VNCIGWWFSLGKADILLKVVLNTTDLTITIQLLRGVLLYMYMTKLGQLAIQSKTLHDFFINRSPNHTLYQTAGIT
jgi:hypothetical protein